MRYSILLVLLMVLFGGAGYAETVRHLPYESSASDEGLYLFLSDFIEYEERCLDGVIAEEPHVNMSKKAELKMDSLMREVELYELKGVETNLSVVINPFYKMSKGVNLLVKSQNDFLNEMKNESYVDARYSLLNMKFGLSQINQSIDEIDEMELSGGYIFDVSDLRNKTEDIALLIENYEELFNKTLKIPITGKLLIASVSDTNPVLGEEVLIQVFAKNLNDITLYIDGKDVYHVYLPGNGTFYTTHTFTELGEHVLFAEGKIKLGVVRSNIIRLDVRKIPTHILLSYPSNATVGEWVEVKGKVVDEYGRVVDSVFVNVSGSDGYEVGKIDKEYFTVNATRKTEGFLNLSVSYLGNDTHEGSYAECKIFFSRIPIHIVLSTDNTTEVRGSIFSYHGHPEYALPIHLVVNSTEEVVNTRDKFNITLDQPGRYEVYAYFEGDTLYAPAMSNKIFVDIQGRRVPYLLLLLSGGLLLVYLIKPRIKRGRGEDEIEKKIEEVKSVEPRTEYKPEHKKPENYKELFDRLVSKYGLKKSLTPRELLRELEGKPEYEKLKIITELHEKAVYGSAGLNEKEREEYSRLLGEVGE